MGTSCVVKQGGKPPLESETQRDILLAAAGLGCRLMRNNVGVLKDITGRHVTYGVGGTGGADLIGWATVGQQAVFLAVEVKRKGRAATPEQEGFLSAVRAFGGIGVLAYSVQDVLDAVTGYREAHGAA
jgi:hypothetical protein